MGERPEHYFVFCPRCGHQLSTAEAHGRPVLSCPSCGFIFYQNPKPAVAAFIVNERNELLLVERAAEPNKGDWDIPGGFMEWDEPPDAAVIREIREELDATFTPSSLLGIYHDWYDSQGLTLAVLNIYYVGPITGELHPADDVASFRWFPLDALPSNIAFDHIRRVVHDYRKQP